MNSLPATPTTNEAQLIASLNALSAQAGNAAWILEHRDDGQTIATLADAGKTIDDRFDEFVSDMRVFQEMTDRALAARETDRTKETSP